MTQISLAVEGNLEKALAAEARAVERGVRNGLRRTTFGIRTNLRGQIKRAGLGDKFPKLVAARIRGRGIDAEGFVFSRGILKPVAGVRKKAVDLVQLYAEGAEVRAAGGGWMAIPTEFAPLVSRPRGKPRRATPKETEARGFDIRFVKTASGGVLVARHSGREVVTHVLVKRVTVRKRFDIPKALRRWEPRFPQILLDELRKAERREPLLRENRLGR